MVTQSASDVTNPPQVSTVDIADTVSRSDLDARGDQVVVLDAQGMIVMVNTAWRQFSRARSPLPGQMAPHTEIGANYLEIAARGSLRADGADRAVSGIRAVLSGQLDAFSLSYPCHTPCEQRWFRMTVTPLMWESQRAVLVAHTDATPRHRLQAG